MLHKDGGCAEDKTLTSESLSVGGCCDEQVLLGTINIPRWWLQICIMFSPILTLF